MSKLWKAVATVLVLVVLFLPGVQRILPYWVWVVALAATLTYGVSLALSPRLSLGCSLGAAYLALVGFGYFLGGFLGLLPNADLIETSMWEHLLVSPYLLVSFLGELIDHFPHTASRAPYALLPASDHHLYSAAAVLAGVAGALSAFGLAAGRRLANKVWLVLLCVSGGSLLGYLLVGFVSWGLRETIIPFCWVISYLAAYLLVRGGRDLTKEGSSQ